MNSIDFQEYLVPCCDIAQEAGRRIMRHFKSGLAIENKADGSPVTAADTEAHDYIVNKLRVLTPDIPVISEEDMDHTTNGSTVFWLVDPLDGTRAFVKGEPEFTVNIGLIEDGRPVLGIIYAPPQKLLYYGAMDRGSFKVEKGCKSRLICTKVPSNDGLIVVKSKSHPSAKTQAYLDTLKIKEVKPRSSSIKFCMVADGTADIYPRFGRTMEWDTAAGHAILAAVGGHVKTVDSQPLIYGKPGFENPGFIALGGSLR